MNHLQVNLLLFQQTEKYGDGWWIWWGCPVKWFKKCFSSNPKGTISPYSDVQIMFFWLSPLSWRNPNNNRTLQSFVARDATAGHALSVPTHVTAVQALICFLFFFSIYSLCVPYWKQLLSFFSKTNSTMCFSREILLTQILEELY